METLPKLIFLVASSSPRLLFEAMAKLNKMFRAAKEGKLVGRADQRFLDRLLHLSDDLALHEVEQPALVRGHRVRILALHLEM